MLNILKPIQNLVDPNRKAFRQAQAVVPKVNAFEKEISSLSDEQLKEKTNEFKARLSDGESLDDLLPEAFAVVREAAKRTLNMRHFDVQLIGGAVLHFGNIAEMKTGEGKTLVATLPAYLNALEGKGVHVVTVNDYLSRRDAVWMGQIYDFLGLSVGIINHESSFLYDPEHQEKDEERDKEGYHKVVYDFLKPVTRRQAYEADITYGTNQEFGFDYLRDNLAYSKYELRQREHNFAIVDEIDSILIDEARTPLIISAPAQEAEKLYTQFAAIARTLQKGVDYEVDEKMRAVQITDEGISKVERSLGISNLYTEAGLKMVHHLENAIKAKALYEKDRDYVIRDGEVVIVDEFTGRMQPGRRWSEGLHQAIEAKEAVEIKQESRTYASVTYQNYFRLYKKLSGMTGTAETSSEEFFKVYGLNTVIIPTNVPSKRIDHNDFIFQTERGKFKALARKVKELQEKGQPVLIGTVSVEKNELLSSYLKQAGIKHEILNAKNHEREGEIIAEAGRKGAVTVATNMAGRGVDIKLGGSDASKEEQEEIRSLGGLFVIGTERHEARRIDNQLRGRAGRQGDPGETQFYVSLEDTLMRVFAGDVVKNMMGKFGIPEDEPINHKMITRTLESAQKKIEGMHFDARKQTLAFDDVLNKQRKAIYRKRQEMLNAEDKDVMAIVLKEVSSNESVNRDELKKLQDLSEKLKKEEDARIINALRRAFLQLIDLAWVDHLETMDHLRNSVNLRAFGQRDPLVEYKKEALRLFRDLQDNFAYRLTQVIPQIIEENMKAKEQAALNKAQENSERISKVALGVNQQDAQSTKKPGRNDPCPCGSGKKFKKCCGANI